MFCLVAYYSSSVLLGCLCTTGRGGGNEQSVSVSAYSSRVGSADVLRSLWALNASNGTIACFFLEGKGRDPSSKVAPRATQIVLNLIKYSVNIFDSLVRLRLHVQNSAVSVRVACLMCAVV